MTTWITAEAAAQRLGVKRATLYAYVSRGILVRKRAPDGRASLFDSGEIEKLATRGRPRREPGGAELVIESALTEITDDHLSYRGHDVTALALTRTFEDVATLLWTGHLPPAPPAQGSTAPSSGPASRDHVSSDTPGSDTRGADTRGADTPGSGTAAPEWQAIPAAAAVGRAVQAALPARALPLERLQVIVPALAAADPLRLHLDPPAVTAAARALIAGMVDSLPSPAPPSPDMPASDQFAPDTLAPDTLAPDTLAPDTLASAIADRLWRKLCPHPPEPGLLGALRAALVLLADHELAASTLAARVAASVRADPYAVVATGLGALGGPLHGGASLGTEGMLAAAATRADAPRVVADRLRLTGRVPGFGHFVYKSADPRATCLLGLITRAAPRSPRLAIANAVLAEMRQRALPAPNIDFALALLKDVSGMISGAGEAIFAVARTAGWTAHALEEYARATPLRPRAIYTGPPLA